LLGRTKSGGKGAFVIDVEVVGMAGFRPATRVRMGSIATVPRFAAQLPSVVAMLIGITEFLKIAAERGCNVMESSVQPGQVQRSGIFVLCWDAVK
jgi:hypothetical protein